VSLALSTVAAASVASVNQNSAGYDLVLLAHVLAAVAALVAVAVAGGFAMALRNALRRGGPVPEVLVRYYRPGVNWAGRVLFAVPVLGAVLIAMSGGEWSWSDTWVSLGTAAWAAVAVVAEAVLWPHERRLQQAVASAGGGDGVDPDGGRSESGAAVEARCLRAGLVASGCAVTLVAVAVLMAAKP
jgi:hypothetical protein